MSQRPGIVAIATAPLTAALGVIRMSGAQVPQLFEPLLGRPLQPRVATVVHLRDGLGRVLDQAVAVWFQAPHSFTGEDVLELSTHGSPALMQLVVERLLGLGLSLARAGEFTERAFLNGKLDLAQAEAVADVIHASSQAAVLAAQRSLAGEFSQHCHSLSRQLVHLRVEAEACLDFPEEDLPPQLSQRRGLELAQLQLELERLIQHSRSGQLLNSGVRVGLLGAPNVGKSSLLNALSGEDIAIVSMEAGTTRDLVRHRVLIAGLSVELVDTAGLHASDNVVEQLGMAKSRSTAEISQLVLVVVDLSDLSASLEVLHQLPQSTPKLVVANKADIASADAHLLPPGSVVVSAKTGQGLEQLRQALCQRLGYEPEASHHFSARARHLDALHRAHAEIAAASAVTAELELFAEHLRLAQHHLDAITGVFSTEDLLGEIFSSFCIGK